MRLNRKKRNEETFLGMCSIADYYGEANQRIKCIEECGELIQAIAKDDPTEHIIEELADVHIMTVQLAYLLGAEEFTRQVEHKVDRQINRILDEMFVDCSWK